MGVTALIPKTIHYIWLGEKPKPVLVNMCILSWKDKLSDYNIIEWNEKNVDIEKMAQKNRFFGECCKRHMWAYMSDYIRLNILYKYGGIYMDTDMQVIKNLEPLLNNNAFAGQEDEFGTVNCAIMGCEKENPVIGKILSYYQNDIWHIPEYTIPQIFTKVLNNNVDINLFRIYPTEYFYPYAYDSFFDMNSITKNTFTIHWWNASWHDKLSPYIFLTTKNFSQPMKTVIALKRFAGFYKKKIFK